MPHPKHILVASCLIRNRLGELLLVKHKQRGWELPQGRVEEGEALLDALHREVLEETGVTISNPQLIDLWSKVSEPAALICCFTADYLAGEPTPSEETPQVDWVPEAEVLQLIEHPVNRERVVSLLEEKEGPAFRSYQTGPFRVLSRPAKLFGPNCGRDGRPAAYSGEK